MLYARGVLDITVSSNTLCSLVQLHTKAHTQNSLDCEKSVAGVGPRIGVEFLEPQAYAFFVGPRAAQLEAGEETHELNSPIVGHGDVGYPEWYRTEKHGKAAYSC